MNGPLLLRSMAGKALWEQRRALLGWGAGLALFMLAMVSFWPTIEEQGAQFQQLIESYPPAMKALLGDLKDFTTPAGYLRAELFGLMLPLLLLVYAIGRGADLVAGEEERGALELVLAHPVDRRAVVLHRAAAVAAGLAVLGFVSWLALWAGALAVGMDVGAGRLAAAVVFVALLAFLHGMLALAVGAVQGRKGLAVAVAAGVAVAGYVVQAVAGVVAWFEPAKWLSPFHYYAGADAVRLGFHAGYALVLLALSALLLALGTWRFARRDVGT